MEQECEKDYFWNPATCIFENEKYLGTIVADPVITGYKYKLPSTSTKMWKFSRMTKKQKHFEKILMKK